MLQHKLIYATTNTNRKTLPVSHSIRISRYKFTKMKIVRPRGEKNCSLLFKIAAKNIKRKNV